MQLDVLQHGGGKHRGDVLAAREEPGERDLRRGGAAPGRDRLDGFHQLQVLLEISRPETRLLAADIVRGDVLDLPDVAGEEAAADLALDKDEIETLSLAFRPGARAGERYDPGYFVTLGA